MAAEEATNVWSVGRPIAYPATKPDAPLPVHDSDLGARTADTATTGLYGFYQTAGSAIIPPESARDNPEGSSNQANTGTPTATGQAGEHDAATTAPDAGSATTSEAINVWSVGRPIVYPDGAAAASTNQSSSAPDDPDHVALVSTHGSALAARTEGTSTLGLNDAVYQTAGKATNPPSPNYAPENTAGLTSEASATTSATTSTAYADIESAGSSVAQRDARPKPTVQAEEENRLPPIAAPKTAAELQALMDKAPSKELLQIKASFELLDGLTDAVTEQVCAQCSQCDLHTHVLRQT